MHPYPKFVTNHNGRALRLIKEINTYYYYSDRGDWKIGFKMENDIIITKPHDYMPNMEGDEYFETTEIEWRECNKGYIPKSTKIKI